MSKVDLDERALIIGLKLGSLQRNLRLGNSLPKESELLEIVVDAEHVIDELRDTIRYGSQK